jgi:hypothetical protein
MKQIDTSKASATKDPREKGILKEYICGFCGYKFQQKVRRVMGPGAVGFKGKNNTSSQVRCPFCLNFSKTWTEGIEL